MKSVRFVLPAVLAAALALAGCGGSDGVAPGAGAGAVHVTADDSSCVATATSLPPGVHTFTVENTGDRVTELYVYAAGDTIVGEVENVAPGTTRKLTVTLKAGSYQLGCKPGMTGDAIRSALEVQGPAPSGSAPSSDLRLAAAVRSYTGYIRGEADALVRATRPFVAAVRAGDVAAAKAAYGPARRHYERMEPVAESFGDLDARIDARAGDVPAGTEWTGFHRLERDLWRSGSVAGDGALAARLLTDVRTLAAQVRTTKLTVDQIGNGAAGLLDEVATSKVTGEEERYSHLDLVDFAGNVEGAKAAWAALHPVVSARDAALTAQIDRRFTALTAALAAHARGGSYAPYTSLTQAQVRSLSAAVDALSEPLSRVTAVALGAAG